MTTAERMARLIRADDRSYECNGGLIGTHVRVDGQACGPELYRVAIGHVEPSDLPNLLDAVLVITGRTPRSRPWRPAPPGVLTWAEYNR